MKRFIFLLCSFVLGITLARASVKSIIDLMPANVPGGGWVVYDNVGLPGGFPDTSGWTPVSPTVDVTGATDSSAAIIAAITAAGTSGTVINLPATPGGFLKIDFQIFFQGKRKIVLRGAVDGNGVPTTTLKPSPNANCIVVADSARVNSQTIVSGLTKGSQTIVLDSGASAYSIGDLIYIEVKDDPSIPVVKVDGADYNRIQVSRVTGVNSGTNTLTIFPKLYDDFTIGAVISRFSQRCDFIGVENFLGDMSASTGQAINMGAAYGSWIKNCNFSHADTRFYLFIDCVQCQMSHCRADFSNRYGFQNGGGLTVTQTSGSLFEDNIIYQNFPGFEINTTSGNVFAYNFIDKSSGAAIDTNHNPCNFMNLYEGNAISSVKCDGYFGGTIRDSLYGNLVTGVDDGSPTSNTTLNRFTREYGFFGNLMASPSYGNPNFNNGDFVGTASSNNWKDYGGGAGLTGHISTRTSDTQATITFDSPYYLGQLSDGTHGDLVGHFGSPGITSNIYWNSRANSRRQVGPLTNVGVDPVAHTVFFVDLSSTTGDVYPAVNTNVTVWTGTNGFQEIDAQVQATTQLFNNYFNDTHNIPPGQRIAPDTLAATVAYAGQPSGHPTWWDFTNCPSFPPYDATSPVAAPTNIPAGYRFTQFTPPQQTGAVVGPAGNVLQVIINKPLTAGGGGTGTFTVTASAGPVTPTYTTTSGSLINFSLSRIITDAEIVTVSYVQPGDGWHDVNENDLPSFSNLACQNNSGQTSGATYVYTVNPELATVPIPYDLSNDVDGIYPMVYTQSGYVTNLGFYIQQSSAPIISFKVAMYDSTLHLIGNAAGTFTSGSLPRFVGVDLDSSVHVTSGATYYLLYKVFYQGDPQVLYQTGLTAGSTYYWLGVNYNSWPPSTITLQFQGTAMSCVRSRLIPDAPPPSTSTINVTHTLTVGTLNLP